MIKLSIICPTIRPKNLIKYYNSVEKSCKKFSYEIIFIGPYYIPTELLKTGKVRYIHSYSDPTTCFNMACEIARGEFVLNSTDDGLFLEDSIDWAINLTSQIGERDLINFVYREGALDDESLEMLPIEKQAFQPAAYWKAGFHGPLRLVGIDPNWDLALHFLIRRDYLEELGYLDTRFSYINMNLHILSFTAQKLGSKIYHLPQPGFECSHLQGNSKDHFAIDSAAQEEMPIFNDLFSKDYNPIKLERDSWKNKEPIWGKRFDKNNLITEPPQY